MFKQNLCVLHYNINMVETWAAPSLTADYRDFYNPRLLRLYANAITKDKLNISVSSLKNQNAINLKARGSACIFFNTSVSDTNTEDEVRLCNTTKPCQALESCCTVKHINCRGTVRWSGAASACFLTAGTKGRHPGRRLLSDAPPKGPEADINTALSGQLVAATMLFLI